MHKNCDSSLKSAGITLCRKVFDTSLDSLPKYTTRLTDRCDVCVKKGARKYADAYCTVCCKKYCNQHLEVIFNTTICQKHATKLGSVAA